MTERDIGLVVHWCILDIWEQSVGKPQMGTNVLWIPSTIHTIGSSICQQIEVVFCGGGVGWGVAGLTESKAYYALKPILTLI